MSGIKPRPTLCFGLPGGSGFTPDIQTSPKKLQFITETTEANEQGTETTNPTRIGSQLHSADSRPSVPSCIQWHSPKQADSKS